MKKLQIFSNDLNIFTVKKQQQQQQSPKNKNKKNINAVQQDTSQLLTNLPSKIPDLDIKKLNCPTTLDTPVKQKKFQLTTSTTPSRINSSNSILSQSSSIVSPFYQEYNNNTNTNDSNNKNRNTVEKQVIIPKQSHEIFRIPEIVNIIVKNLKIDSTTNLSETLTVNRLFNDISDYYNKKKEIKIMNGKQLLKFNEYYEFQNSTTWLKPERVIIYCTEYNITHLNINFNDLKYLEIRGCKKMTHFPIQILNNFTQNLKILKLPGCTNFSNNGLLELLPYLKKLEELDLRQCYRITDSSLIKLISTCPKINSLNLNRIPLQKTINTANPQYYTKYALSDRILHAIIDNNLPLHTLGIAGSNITDQAMWELCTGRSTFTNDPWNHKLRYTLKRLSCNDCLQLSDLGLPRIISKDGFPNLQVLEIKNLNSLQNSMSHFFNFKICKELQGIPILISCCAFLQKEMDFLQKNYNVDVIDKVLTDLNIWCNNPASPIMTQNSRIGSNNTRYISYT